jgi:hypothetical protein
MLDWVPMTAYLAEAKGETADAVDGRLRRGHWLRGVHTRRPEGAKELWINLRAVEDWAAGKTPAHEHGNAR